MTAVKAATPAREPSLQVARRLLGLGLSVIPVPCPQPGVPSGRPGDGKVPALSWREYQTRLPTAEEIDDWFGATPMNLAIITGAVSGVVGIDADSKEAVRWAVRRLPYTPWQTQTARGFHLYYRHSGIRVPNRAGLETRDGRLALDARGDGGFLIAAGSLHASGAEYLEAGDWREPRERMPVFWPGWLARPPRSATPATTLHPIGEPRAERDPQRDLGHLVARARAYLVAMPRPEIGHNSDAATLYAACRLVRGFGLGAGETEALLWEWAGGRPGWTRAWVARKVAHAERYGTEPVGALR